ncbi:hypothetical protein M2399_004825 [Pseudomonas sp. BIGb0450]|uniref:hypothetical protein n=1 Tax=unclassified Pseudomonas TaxID=196821 RepID=UPI00216AA4D2|nr:MULTISPECIES: hypothetical protein [unclassified Pseudomonas]MCS3416023.1 hypothetical protein [Pseudomonas sp. BIGb0558]MCS3439365.1 hypothetical protein [Pseudomonas sp. BIGb0450]
MAAQTKAKPEPKSAGNASAGRQPLRAAHSTAPNDQQQNWSENSPDREQELVWIALLFTSSAPYLRGFLSDIEMQKAPEGALIRIIVIQSVCGTTGEHRNAHYCSTDLRGNPSADDLTVYPYSYNVNSYFESCGSIPYCLVCWLVAAVKDARAAL